MSSRWFQVSLTEANIYVVANPSLRSGSPKRTKKRIATVPHLDLDFDIDGEARLTSLRASDTVPAPTAVLATSLDKYQILWRVDGFTFEQQKSTLKLLTIAFGSDPACTDCNRILHVPGLLNCEYDPAYPVASNTLGIPLGIPMTFGWIFQQGTPCFRPGNPIAKASRYVHESRTRLGVGSA